LRGAYRDRHDTLGAGCDGCGGVRLDLCQAGRERCCIRRSRVVLTPRRWRQVCGSLSADDGGKKARSPGRSRRKPLKPSRGECRVFPGVPAVTNACAFYTTHAAAGASGARHSPCPLFFEGRCSCTTRALCAARMRSCILASSRSWLSEIRIRTHDRAVVGSPAEARGTRAAFAEGFGGQPCARFASEGWCPWPESNQHSLRNSILSRARLPIPPQGPSDPGLRASVAKSAEYSGRRPGVNPRCRRVGPLAGVFLRPLVRVAEVGRSPAVISRVLPLIGMTNTPL
jgi:hypothetical protein